MKIRNWSFAGIAICCLSCNSSGDKVRLTDSLVNHREPRVIDTTALIIPGKSIGKIYLGEESTNLSSLGTPDDGDAAMGRAWSIWFAKDTIAKIQDYAAYTSYRDTSMKIKEVKQIRTENPKYTLANAIKVGSSLASVKNAYNELTLGSRYVNVKKDTLHIYEARKIGASFDVIKDTVRAISVQYSGTPGNETYLTIHPGWKRL